MNYIYLLSAEAPMSGLRPRPVSPRPSTADIRAAKGGPTAVVLGLTYGVLTRCVRSRRALYSRSREHPLRPAGTASSNVVSHDLMRCSTTSELLQPPAAGADHDRLGCSSLEASIASCIGGIHSSRAHDSQPCTCDARRIAGIWTVALAFALP